MIMIWHRYNEEDSNNDSAGIWYALKELTKEEVEQYAHLHVDGDIVTSVI